MKQSLGENSFGFYLFLSVNTGRILSLRNSALGSISDLCIIWPTDTRMTHGIRMKYLLANSLFPVVKLDLLLRAQGWLLCFQISRTGCRRNPVWINGVPTDLSHCLNCHLSDWCVSVRVCTVTERLAHTHASLHLSLHWLALVYIPLTRTPDAFPASTEYLFRLQSRGPDRFQKHNHLLLIWRSRAKNASLY